MRVLIVLFALVVLAQPGLTQGLQQDNRPLVVFIEDSRAVQTASVTDSGPDGVTRLAEMFIAQGARTAWVRLTDALPEDARVIVMVRPRQSLNAAYLARIWLQMERGAHLLLAIDPPGHVGIRPEPQNSGMDRLLTLDYGVSLLNGLLIEPWFTLGTIHEIQTSYLYAESDPVPNPIFEPLARYELPVRLWGARPLQVEPIGIDSQAAALVTVSSVYAETTSETLRLADPLPLELNIGTDPQGSLNVAAVGENARSGSRIAVIGDGEFVQNGFGLNLIGDTTIPRYPGNYILVERIVAWLMGSEDFPALPEGLTWLALDGDASEWGEIGVALNDSEADTALNPLNLTELKAFRNDQFVYMALQTRATPMPETRVDLELDRNLDGSPDAVLSMQPDGAFFQSGVEDPAPVLDAAMAIGEIVELRMPRRLLDANILSVCMSSARELAFPQPPDCSDSAFALSGVTDRDPVSVRTPREIIVTTSVSNSVNLRQAPSIEATVLTTYSFGAELAAIGRDRSGQWIYVQDGRWLGWLSAEIVHVNGDISTLPVAGQ